MTINAVAWLTSSVTLRAGATPAPERASGEGRPAHPDAGGQPGFPATMRCDQTTNPCGDRAWFSTYWSGAAATAAGLAERLGPGAGSLLGTSNEKAVETAVLVLLAVPYAGQDDLVASLAPLQAGRVVISCVNPLGFDKAGPYGLDLGGTSAAEQTQALVPDATSSAPSTTSRR